MKNLKQHTLSAAWPAMHADEYQSLKDSIGSIGVLNPITLFEGMVIDGWHRYKAASDLGVTCPSKLLSGIDPVDFVKSQNDSRRHLTASQRALAITAINAWKPVGKPSNSAATAELKTTKQMAVEAKTGTRSIEQAKVVHAKAIDKVRDAVKSGKLAVEKAAVIAMMPQETQAAAIDQPLPKSPPAKNDQAQDIAFREVPAQSTTTHDDEPDCGPDADELAAQEAAEVADHLAMQKLLDSDSKLADSFELIKRLNLEVARLKIARNIAMNRANEANQTIKKRDYQIKLLQEHSTAALADYQTEDV